MSKRFMWILALAGGVAAVAQADTLTTGNLIALTNLTQSLSSGKATVAGKLGVGTTSPTDKCEIRGGATWLHRANNGTNDIVLNIGEQSGSNNGTPAFRLLSWDFSGWGFLQAQATHGGASYYWQRVGQAGIQNMARIEGSDSLGHYFTLFDKTTTTEKVRLHGAGDSYLNGGNVGIGTNAPAVKLHVKGAGRFDDGITFLKALGDVSMGVYTNKP